MLTQIRDFQILSKIGEGGMGEVYLAEDINLERKVALKVLSPILAQNEEIILRFRQEAKVQAGLSHKNLVTLHSFFQESGTYYMVLEFATGVSLKEVIKTKGKIPVNTILQIFTQLLEGIGYAHMQGVVHRDLKPSNIMIDESRNSVKVLDFGIAKILGDRGLTRTGVKMGTMYYMSPEQVMASKDIDQRTDIYSLGVILYEMLTGTLPYDIQTESDFKIMNEIVNSEFPDVRKTIESVPGTLAEIIRSMTIKNHDNRPATCFQIEQMLKGVLAEPVIEVKKPIQKVTLPPVQRVNSFEPEMVTVEGGSFNREAAGFFKTKIFRVTIDSFKIGKFPVTQKEWKGVMGNNPSNFKDDDLPVEMVSWNDVQEYINKLKAKTGKKYRLPTEAEWEYAARGGNKSRNCAYSGSNKLDEVAWYDGNSGSKTHSVGTKKPNELGIYDMSGNVWEWCSDWYGEDCYKNSPERNPKGPSSGSSRLLRGGSWNYHNNNCRVSTRDNYIPVNSNSFVGFRVVEEL